MSRHESLTDRLVQVIRGIPKGRVATYGQNARMAGNPRAARQVVRVLCTLSEKEHLPWHRVINSNGRISLSGEGYRIQRAMLESERIVFDRTDRIPLRVFQWREVEASSH